MESCRFGNSCWRPLCPDVHACSRTCAGWMAEVIETAPEEDISERFLEQFVEAFEPVPPQEENVEVILLPPHIKERTQIVDICTNRSSMCQCLRRSINQVTKYAKIPQIQYIDKVVDMRVMLQRQVLQIQGVLKTEEDPTAQFIDRVVEAPVIMQMRQCRLSRDEKHAPRAHLGAYTDRLCARTADFGRAR